MTAPPLALADVDWRAVQVAGLLALYGITATAAFAAPLVCDCAEIDCPDGHLWITPEQPAAWGRAGGAA